MPQPTDQPSEPTQLTERWTTALGQLWKYFNKLSELNPVHETWLANLRSLVDVRPNVVVAVLARIGVEVSQRLHPKQGHLFDPDLAGDDYEDRLRALVDEHLEDLRYWLMQVEDDPREHDPDRLVSAVEAPARNTSWSDEEAAHPVQNFALPGELLPPSTWLIHFTDHASNIVAKGFQYGTHKHDIDRLGLTTWFSSDTKRNGVFDFAFDVEDPEARHGHKYGEQAVMFQAAGIKVYHTGDKEHQVIFDGASVRPDSIVRVGLGNDGWYVDGGFNDPAANPRPKDKAKNGSFADMVEWVKAHAHQYRRKWSSGYGYNRKWRGNPQRLPIKVAESSTPLTERRTTALAFLWRNMRALADPGVAAYSMIQYASDDTLRDVLDAVDVEVADDADYDVLHELIDQHSEAILNMLRKNDVLRQSIEHDMHRSGEGSGSPALSFDVGSARLLPPTTWLVHFTNNPSDIVNRGFQYGVPEFDTEQLGLTTGARETTENGHFAFAFPADAAREIRAVSRANKYGKHAVAFQSAAILAYHHGDEEWQAIFDGAAVRPDSIFAVLRDDNTGEWVVENDEGRVLVRNENIQPVIDWVIANHGQYRRGLSAGYRGRVWYGAPRRKRIVRVKHPDGSVSRMHVESQGSYFDPSAEYAHYSNAEFAAFRRGGRSGQGAGALFFVRADDPAAMRYARLYGRREYRVRLDLSRDQVFDLSNPQHVERVRAVTSDMTEEGDTGEDFLRSAVMHASGLDWATINGDVLRAAGFEAAVVGERPAGTHDPEADSPYPHDIRSLAVFDPKVIASVQARLGESFATTVVARGMQVDVFLDPSTTELRKEGVLSYDQARIFLLGDRAYVWNGSSALHAEVATSKKIPGFDDSAIPLIGWFHPGTKNLMSVTVTDYSERTRWHHNPGVMAAIQEHPWVMRVSKNGLGLVHVSYYDEAIVGDWKDIKEERALREATPPEEDRDLYKMGRREWTPEYKAGDDVHAYYAREGRWDRAVEWALFTGKLTLKQARANGFHPSWNESSLQPLPKKLYHTTTARSAVRKNGLRTRRELDGVHRGLGGGPDDMISFTDDRPVAYLIANTIMEAIEVLRDREGHAVERLLDAAERGRGHGVSRPFLHDIWRLHSGSTETDTEPAYIKYGRRRLAVQESNARRRGFAERDGRVVESAGEADERVLPEGSVIVPEGGNWKDAHGVTFYRLAAVPMTDDQAREFRWQVFRYFLAARKAAGGMDDPLFFLTHPKALAAVDPSEVAVLEFEPADPAYHGLNLGDGLGEWRVPDQSLLRLVSEHSAGQLRSADTEVGRYLRESASVDESAKDPARTRLIARATDTLLSELRKRLVAVQADPSDRYLGHVRRVRGGYVLGFNLQIPEVPTVGSVNIEQTSTEGIAGAYSPGLRGLTLRIPMQGEQYENPVHADVAHGVSKAALAVLDNDADEKTVRSVFHHELAHALDLGMRRPRPDDYHVRDDVYYNTDVEVHAYTTQLLTDEFARVKHWMAVLVRGLREHDARSVRDAVHELHLYVRAVWKFNTWLEFIQVVHPDFFPRAYQHLNDEQRQRVQKRLYAGWGRLRRALLRAHAEIERRRDDIRAATAKQWDDLVSGIPPEQRPGEASRQYYVQNYVTSPGEGAPPVDESAKDPARTRQIAASASALLRQVRDAVVRLRTSDGLNPDYVLRAVVDTQDRALGYGVLLPVDVPGVPSVRRVLLLSPTNDDVPVGSYNRKNGTLSLRIPRGLDPSAYYVWANNSQSVMHQVLEDTLDYFENRPDHALSVFHHELAHAGDPGVHQPNRKTDNSSDDLATYYNSDVEVHAYVTQALTDEFAHVKAILRELRTALAKGRGNHIEANRLVRERLGVYYKSTWNFADWLPQLLHRRPFLYSAYQHLNDEQRKRVRKRLYAGWARLRRVLLRVHREHLKRATADRAALAADFDRVSAESPDVQLGDKDEFMDVLAPLPVLPVKEALTERYGGAEKERTLYYHIAPAWALQRVLSYGLLSAPPIRGEHAQATEHNDDLASYGGVYFASSLSMAVSAASADQRRRLIAVISSLPRANALDEDTVTARVAFAVRRGMSNSEAESVERRESDMLLLYLLLTGVDIDFGADADKLRQRAQAEVDYSTHLAMSAILRGVADRYTRNPAEVSRVRELVREAIVAGIVRSAVYLAYRLHPTRRASTAFDSVLYYLYRAGLANGTFATLDSIDALRNQAEREGRKLTAAEKARIKTYYTGIKNEQNAEAALYNHGIARARTDYRAAVDKLTRVLSRMLKTDGGSARVNRDVKWTGSTRLVGLYVWLTEDVGELRPAVYWVAGDDDTHDVLEKQMRERGDTLGIVDVRNNPTLVKQLASTLLSHRRGFQTPSGKRLLAKKREEEAKSSA